MFNSYPYTNFHELNQDWILSILKKFENELKQAIDYKTIHYADPLQWNITTQYAPNTVVVDENTGIAYISKDSVPSGILLSDKNYWMVIFDYQKIYNKIMSGVAFNEKDNETASKDLLVNDLVWYHGDLYRVTRAISVGSKYIVGSNLVATTIDSLLSNYYGRDRVSQLNNDTLNVSGDYTVNAGDIAETSSNRTEKVTSDREIDIDGNDSIHVDGDVTEVYENSRNVDVTGINTEKYHETMNETFNKKHNVYGQDETNQFNGNIDNTANKFTFNSKEKSFILHFPDKNKNLYENYSPYNVKEMGCVGDGITDDTNALQNIINKYQGEIIFLPKGKYLISKTLILPNSTHIEGCGEDSVIIPDNSFTDIIIKSTHYGDDSNIYDANFKLVNFTIDGNYSDYINYIKKRGDLTTQHGICIKGEQFELDKMIIRNCGGNGFMVYNNANRIVTNFGTAGTSYIINSKIMFNAKHGIVSDGAVDWVLHNSTIHSNSRRAMNDSNNLEIISGNCKISDCHFFSLYGSIKPYASVAIEKTASSVQMVNCHVEGASNPLVLYGYRCFFSNCRFYSSFEYCDVRMDADDCCFIGCEFYPQVTDAVPGNYPNFLGAFVFEKNDPSIQRNNRLVLKGCSLHQTKFTSSTVNLGYYNNIELNGTANEVGAVDFAKCSYFINGVMNQGAQTLYSTPFGFPIASTVGIFDIDSVDVNLSSTYNFINSIASGNLVIMKPTLGMLCLIMNETNQNIVLKAPNNCLINGIPSITLLPYSLNFFLGQSESNWKWHSTKR